MAFSPEIYAMEKEQIFMKYWLSVGRVEEISEVGDYFTFQVMKESIVVSRPAPDQVVAYMNQCLHRGVEIAVGRGNANEFSCPYHAWLYDVSGKLVVAPGMKASEVELKNCSLRQLHVKLWRGWIFVNFSDEPMSFDAYIAPFEQPLWWFQTDHCKLAQKVEIDVKCNWKFLCCIPDDHMAACETDPASPCTTASWPASASCCPVLTAAAGGCTRPHSAARSAPYLHGC